VGGGATHSRSQKHRLYLGQPGPEKSGRRRRCRSLYIDRNGLALECTTSNIFAFIDNTLVTPGRGILSGVTRKVVLELAERRCFHRCPRYFPL
jgi:branched-subunit amino acid aminotransferase/4-amino-4-deoxychorismate lyase